MYHSIATPKLRLCGPKVTGVDGGTKTTDEVGCLHTLMNSLNEVISVLELLVLRYHCANVTNITHSFVKHL